jgi:hypothetical protein
LKSVHPYNPPEAAGSYCLPVLTCKSCQNTLISALLANTTHTLTVLETLGIHLHMSPNGINTKCHALTNSESISIQKFKLQSCRILPAWSETVNMLLSGDLSQNYPLRKLFRLVGGHSQSVS